MDDLIEPKPAAKQVKVTNATSSQKPGKRTKRTSKQNINSKSSNIAGTQTSSDKTLHTKVSYQEANKLSKVTQRQRRNMVELAAYFIAEKRGFSNGDPKADWLLAESQINGQLANRS